ncbi:hypothetical protein RM545_05860 [Zunongwangia sp. F260]|uniref:Glycoside hydrolase family 2 catalytic domain-containing protein n=1 Tax=Autumnicola lenta TaxID=3075593 RepID=A0ABU3CIM2_9FLAO|nr:hypothetical protein [Zunongwangia sp. F260]MDT0646207.1 hypothetical protein [Zunongwangia sp. F260]
MLDRAEDLQLAVVADIPLPKFYNNQNYWSSDMNGVKQRIAKTVSQHKDHPALLYWNLGNEIGYPEVYEFSDFFKNFNGLIEVIHKNDPFHPVSTALIAGSRRTLISISLRSPQLDFVSLNSFGSLRNLAPMLESISLLWDGPYVISEWGINGPWEEEETSWGAPIEQTSTKKAEILPTRYYSEVLQDKSCLGSFYFYWGTKYERTNTWFSLFQEDSTRSQVFYSLKNVWNNKKSDYKGPEIKYALLNDRGAMESIVLNSGSTAKAELLLQNPEDSLNIHWVIRKEAWENILEETSEIKNKWKERFDSKAIFEVPKEEGPYRIFVYVKDRNGNHASTNIPFYVINPVNGKN